MNNVIVSATGQEYHYLDVSDPQFKTNYKLVVGRAKDLEAHELCAKPITPEPDQIVEYTYGLLLFRSKGTTFCFGLLHREDGPAIIGKNLCIWYIGGEMHREDGPAIETSHSKEWFINGKLHRLDGPAIQRKMLNNKRRGYEAWFVDGKKHRLDNPAILEENGTNKWYVDDKLHRKDGPAIEYANGDKEWWENGVLLRKYDYLANNPQHAINIGDIVIRT